MSGTTNKRLERFYEGFVSGLKDVHADWRSLSPSEQKRVFKKVTDVAKELIVGKGEGNGGIALSTFNIYVRKVTRALIFNVPLAIAEKATNQQLQHAKYHVREVMKDAQGTDEEKMVRAYQDLLARGFRFESKK